MVMGKDPWTDSDPQPGDFDPFLESIDPDDPSQVERRDSRPARGGGLVIAIEGEEAERLKALSREQGRSVSEVVSDLVRSA